MPTSPDTKMSALHDATRRRYSERYGKLGVHIRTLGWGSEEQQKYRFARTLEQDIDWDGKTVLDIGCGFGDYYDFLCAQEVPFSRYVGWDINPDFVREAGQRHGNDPRAMFEVRNVFEQQPPEGQTYDIGVMLGVLNFHWKEAYDNVKYTHSALRTAFNIVRKALIVDFLSEHTTETYPREDFVFYHQPGDMLNFALSLTPDVTLKHNYAPIPQKEFMLYMYKNNSPGRQ